MTIPGFILKNTFRNKRRALLCVMSVAISLFLLVTLLMVLREITQPMQGANAGLRVAVRNKISIASALPYRQLAIIEKIPGVESVTPLVYFGGTMGSEDQVAFAQFGVEAERFLTIFDEVQMKREDYQAWLADRTSCIVGEITAKKEKLAVGDKITLIGQIYPVDLELRVVGFYHGTPDDRSIWFHHKYWEDAMGDPGETGMWWIKARRAEDVPRLIDEVNGAFANTSSEVLAETERAFQLSFASMWGNIKVLIGSICSVVLFTLVLVTASTMSMAIRERMREMSILKTLGFRRRELFAFILAESCGLVAVGWLCGAGGAWALFTFVDAGTLTGGIFPYLEVTPRMLGQAGLAAVVLGIASSIAPSVAMARLSVVEGLKTLD